MGLGIQNKKGFKILAAAIIIAVVGVGAAAVYYFSPQQINKREIDEKQGFIDHESELSSMRQSQNGFNVSDSQKNNDNQFVFADFFVSGSHVGSGYGDISLASYLKFDKSEVFIIQTNCDSNEDINHLTAETAKKCRVIGIAEKNKCFAGDKSESKSAQQETVATITIAKCYPADCAPLEDDKTKKLCLMVTEKKYQNCGVLEDEHAMAMCFDYIVNYGKIDLNICQEIAKKANHIGFECAEKLILQVQTKQECDELAKIATVEIADKCYKKLAFDTLDPSLCGKDDTFCQYEADRKKNEFEQKKRNQECQDNHLSEIQYCKIRGGAPDCYTGELKCEGLPCRKEGDIFTDSDEECCGLTKITTEIFGKSKFTCVYCGNRICGKYETAQNCPKDCGTPVMQEPRQCYNDVNCRPECGGICESKLLPDDGGGHCEAMSQHACFCRYGECIPEPPNKI